MEKYFALFDLQIDGFKAGIASELFEEVERSGAERVRCLSEHDEESAPTDVTDAELLEMYGYEVREVTEEQYNKILDSEEYGLTVSVIF